MPYETAKTHCIRLRGRANYLEGPFKNSSTNLEIKKEDVKSHDFVVS